MEEMGNMSLSTQGSKKGVVCEISHHVGDLKKPLPCPLSVKGCGVLPCRIGVFLWAGKGSIREKGRPEATPNFLMLMFCYRDYS